MRCRFWFIKYAINVRVLTVHNFYACTHRCQCSGTQRTTNETEPKRHRTSYLSPVERIHFGRPSRTKQTPTNFSAFRISHFPFAFSICIHFHQLRGISEFAGLFPIPNGSPDRKWHNSTVNCMRIQIAATKYSRFFSAGLFSGVECRAAALRYRWMHEICVSRRARSWWFRSLFTLHSVFRCESTTIHNCTQQFIRKTIKSS